VKAKRVRVVELLGRGAAAAAAWPPKLPRGCVGHAVCTITPGSGSDTADEQQRQQRQQRQQSSGGGGWSCPLLLGGMAESDQELQEGFSEQGVSCYIWSPWSPLPSQRRQHQRHQHRDGAAAAAEVTAAAEDLVQGQGAGLLAAASAANASSLSAGTQTRGSGRDEGNGGGGGGGGGRWLRLPNMTSERAAFACSAL
jgi:hypothetical protein